MKGRQKKTVLAYDGREVTLEEYVKERKGDRRKDGTRGPSTFYWYKDRQNIRRLRALPGHPDYIADLTDCRQADDLDPHSGQPVAPAPASRPAPKGLAGTIGQHIHNAIAAIDKKVSRGLLKPVTARGYVQNMQPIIRNFSGVAEGELTQAFLQRAIDIYEDQPRQARNMRQAWDQIARAAMRAGAIDRNVAQGLELPPLETEHIAPWSLRALEAMLAHAPQHMADAIRLRAYSGLRRIDACALTHMSFRGDGITGNQSKAKGKRIKPFFVPLYPELRQIIDQIRTHQPDPSKPLLLDGNGKPWRQHTWAHAFRTLRSKAAQTAHTKKDANLAAEIMECKSHGLRSTAACFLLMALKDKAQVAAITGHSNVNQIDSYTAPILAEIRAKAAGEALAKSKETIPLF